MNADKGVAIISGGLGDLGLAIGKKLAAEGYTIAALYRTAPASLSEALAHFGPGEHATYQCDFEKPEEITATISKIHAQFKTVSAGVHAAWTPVVRASLLESSAYDVRAQFEVGVMGGFIFLQALGRVMREQKCGTLVGITTSNIEPNVASGNIGAYVPAKYALRGMLRVLALELAPAGVRVHAVAPGVMQAGMNKGLPPRLFELLQSKNPMQKSSTPEDVAEVVAFLCSPAAKNMTGLSLSVSAGDAIEL